MRSINGIVFFDFGKPMAGELEGSVGDISIFITHFQPAYTATPNTVINRYVYAE